MARSHRTSFYAALLLTPLAVSLGYLAMLARPVVETVPAAEQPCVAPAGVLAGVLAVAEPVVAEVVVAEPVVAEGVVAEAVVAEGVVPGVEPVVVGLAVVTEAEDLAGAKQLQAPVIDATVEDPGAAMLLYGGELMVPGQVDPAWFAGKARLIGGREGFTTRLKLVKERLPVGVAAVVGGRYTLYAGDGSSCVIEPRSLSVYARVDGMFQDFEHPPGRDDLQRAYEEMNVDVPRVLAKFAAPRGCTGVWARRSDLPAPVVYGRRAADPSLTAQVMARVLAEPDVIAMQAARAEYLQDSSAEEIAAEGGGWDTFAAAHLGVERWDELGGTRSVVTVEIGDDGAGCGGFQDEVTLIYTLVDGALVRSEDGGFRHPIAVMDLDGDGHLEAVTAPGDRLESRGQSVLERDATFPDYGCPC